jgi:hypothetical protein
MEKIKLSDVVNIKVYDAIVLHNKSMKISVFLNRVSFRLFENILVRFHHKISEYLLSKLCKK